jgi:hypothetical protein
MSCIAKDCEQEFTTDVWFQIDLYSVFSIEVNTILELCSFHKKELEKIYSHDADINVQMTQPALENRRYLPFRKRT